MSASSATTGASDSFPQDELGYVDPNADDQANQDDPSNRDSAGEHGRPVNLPENAPAEEFFTDFGFGHFVEFSSYEELKKFQKLPPISGDDIETCDFDDTIRRLLSEDK